MQYAARARRRRTRKFEIQSVWVWAAAICAASEMTESATAREHNQKTLLAKGWVARPRSARAVLRRTDSNWPDLRQHCLLRLGFGSRVPHAIKSLPLPSLRVYLFKINLRMLLLFSGAGNRGQQPELVCGLSCAHFMGV